MQSLRKFGDWLREGAKFKWGELTKQSITAIKATSDLGKTWAENAPKVAQLEHFDQLDKFFQAFESPVGKLAVGGLPFVSVGIDLLRLYWEVTKEKPTLAESIAIAAQMAYLRSLQAAIAATNQTPKNALLTKLNAIKLADVFERQLQKLETVDISFTEASSTLSNFPGSALARSLNNVLKTLLVESAPVSPAIDAATASAFAEQVSYSTPQYFHAAVAQIEDKVPELKQFLNSGGQTVQDKYASIERYLVREIDPLPQRQVFDDEKLNEDGSKSALTFKDLYVPLSVQRLDAEGKQEIGWPLEINDWANGVLASAEAKREVMFIQGEAGRGKSVFCRMFASWVRERFAKAWVPILIRLRDVQEIKDSLSETLKRELENADFVQSDAGWLTDPNVRFLLIFDGFDELLLEGRESGGLKDFLQQVAKFQEGCHHQCLITGRPLALQGIDKQLTRIGNLERVRLEPMTDEQRVQWLAKWGELFTAAEATAFCDFLGACPNEISDGLAREPLLLYLLGRLHREKKETFNAQMFAGAEGIGARIKVYDESIKWVLEKQRLEWKKSGQPGENLNERLAGLDSDDLREVLQEAALCVVQSGSETAELAMLRKRFEEMNNPVSQLFERAQNETKQDADKTLNNLLTTFYLQPGKGDKGSVEFAHKSFGEFLFAERLKRAFGDWVELKDKWPRLKDGEVAEQIYDLLGYGALTNDIFEYLRALLFSELGVEDIVRLFQRLHDFYENWSEGVYIDKGPGENLPQRKMMRLNAVGIEAKLRQVDIHAGLNVMILLFELHRYGRQPEHEPVRSRLHFHPCGKVAADADDLSVIDRDKLLRLIGYSQVIQTNYLLSAVGRHLSSADLSSADLSYADLSYADLSSADLSSADLRSADLRYANLSSANLSSANLSSAYLSSADLRSADLRSADLSSADLSEANLGKVRFNAATVWAGVRGLDTARNIPESLREQLGLA